MREDVSPFIHMMTRASSSSRRCRCKLRVVTTVDCLALSVCYPQRLAASPIGRELAVGWFPVPFFQDSMILLVRCSHCLVYED